MNKVSTFYRSKNKSHIGLTSSVAMNQLGIAGTCTECKETLKSDSHEDLYTYVAVDDVNNGILGFLQLLYSSKC